MPIPIEVCGIQSGVPSGVGATSSARHELSASRIELPGDERGRRKRHQLEDDLRDDPRRRRQPHLHELDAVEAAMGLSATDMLRKVSATRR